LLGVVVSDSVRGLAVEFAAVDAVGLGLMKRSRAAHSR
jgi:hypothetical protein